MADESAGTDGAREPSGAGQPQVLCDVVSLSATPVAPGGAQWKLAEPGRQLDANLIRVPPGGGVPPHIEPELDVLVLVVAGDGTLATDPPQPLTAGSLIWLPRGAARSVTAGKEGLAYVTVHRRRPGMQIMTRPKA
ncbi:cupin domain-containing protein [Streptomyces sp. NPDC001595]|uniref:cupin domain-containing protein n=1 Tax=Streptomyces sp. NPDC001532 TaxID=3154520 RepID=UPI00332BDC66